MFGLQIISTLSTVADSLLLVYLKGGNRFIEFFREKKIERSIEIFNYNDNS